jgi:hypothetical protein
MRASDDNHFLEHKVEMKRFDRNERETLLKDGAYIYGLAGETMSLQIEIQKQKGWPSFTYIEKPNEEFLLKPSLISEVAIYPDPNKFFIPNSGMAMLYEQEELTKDDTKDLRQRLQLPGISVIIPKEVSTLTEITFKHLDGTGNWLFGCEYALAHNLKSIYGRTKDSVDEHDPNTAAVGGIGVTPSKGLGVVAWPRNLPMINLWAVRLIVPNTSN